MFVTERSRRMEELGDEISVLYSHISAAMYRWLVLLAEFEQGGGWFDGGYKTCAHWLAWRCGIDIRTARDHVCVARRLRERPLIAAAFERGELSYSKVRAMLRLDDEFDEEQLLMYADSASASQLERIIRGCRRCVRVEQESERQFAEREFHWGHDDDGAIVFGGRLPAELGALVVRAIEAARDELGPPPKEIPAGVDRETAELSQSPRARNADALVAVAQSALAERASSADVYQVVVHVDAESLRGSAEPRDGCRLDDGDPLPTGAARRLTCDASVVEAVERDGKTLSMGRKTRTIAPALRRALQIRDKCCTFPGCTQRYHLDSHHVEHWADGGATDIENLTRLCRYHHRLLHEGGFSVRGNRSGGFTFFEPSGKPIPQAPRQPRGDCTILTRGNTGRGLRPNGMTLFPPHSAGDHVELRWSVEALLDSRRPRDEVA
jgi:Domain of unknown function (DUF222)/HNH endonuclease